MGTSDLPLDAAVDLTRTGDLWLFRGRSAADRSIRALTNAPVNHVGLAVVIDDLPPLLWHAELGRSLPDMWSGARQRGVQLHDLHDAVRVWKQRYGQDAWLRQYDGEVSRNREDQLLELVARRSGTPFPSTVRMVSRWLRGQVGIRASAEVSYCAEVVAEGYQALGLLGERSSNRFDPGSFWSGDELELLSGRLGGEIAITMN